MKIIADLNAGELLVQGAVFPISCNVRTLRDGTRLGKDVVKTIPDGLPYDPRPFPKGTWRVTGIEWQKDKKFDPNTFGPVKIRTDAWQMVWVWELDGQGRYLRQTARQVRDSGYLLHYAVSGTTWGCIRLNSPEDATAVANIISGVLSREEVLLEAV
ncbi:MAG: L,D-transpeptidase family protein [Treponema sp.]|jgi:hypothetical protein|nr:L,D-transpeptidase family protein [Treponema sp.]